MASELCCNVTLPECASGVAYTVLILFQHLYSDIFLFRTHPRVPLSDNHDTFKYLWYFAHLKVGNNWHPLEFAMPRFIFCNNSTDVDATKNRERANSSNCRYIPQRRQYLGRLMITNGTERNSGSRWPTCHVDDTDDTETGLTRTCWSIALCSNRLTVYSEQTETQSAIYSKCISCMMSMRIVMRCKLLY